MPDCSDENILMLWLRFVSSWEHFQNTISAHTASISQKSESECSSEACLMVSLADISSLVAQDSQSSLFKQVQA